MTKTILCMGQSNAVGRTGATLITNERVTFWNNENDRTDTVNPGTAWVAGDVAQRPFVGGKGSFLASVGAYLARLKDPDEAVRVILVATGSQSISAWHNGSSAGAMYSRMQAVLAAAGVAQVDALLWHQGESDEATHATYVTRWNALIARLQLNGHINEHTPIVVGEVRWSQGYNINQRLHEIAAADPRVEIVQMGGYNATDDVHFDDQFTSIIASGYARELCRIPGPWKDLWRGPPISTHHGLLIDPVSQEQKQIPPIDLFPQRHFVLGVGQAVTFPNSVDTKIPLVPLLGKKELIAISSNPAVAGRFTPDRNGIWRFDYQVHTDGGKTRAKLQNWEGKEIWFGGYTGGTDAVGNNPIVSGWAIMRLYAGEHVWLAGTQSSGADKTVTALYSSMFNRMLVTFMGEDG